MLQTSYRIRKRIRLGLLFLGLPQLAIGVYALFFSRDFYRDFPLGRSWADVGPYNEHLVTDVGALFCAMGVIALFGAARVDRRLAQAVALGWIVFTLPHLIFHLSHREGLETADVVSQAAVFVAHLLIALYVLSASRRLKS
jgi:glucose uptake protein GlcU